MNLTKEMLKAGAAKLHALTKDDDGIANQEDAVQEIWDAMVEAKHNNITLTKLGESCHESTT